MSTAVAVQPRVLADLIPRVRARDAVLIVGAAALTAGCAQLTFYLPGNPVPVTAQTFAVLLTGAALGANRGAAAMLLYIALGMFLPVYADGKHGIEVVTGASGGYLIGFLAASWVVGRLAEARMDRTPVKALPLFLLGSAIVYGIGVPWLAISAGQPLDWALTNGFVDFIPGDIVKAIAAAGLLPVVWKLAGRNR